MEQTITWTWVSASYGDYDPLSVLVSDYREGVEDPIVMETLVTAFKTVYGLDLAPEDLTITTEPYEGEPLL